MKGRESPAKTSHIAISQYHILHTISQYHNNTISYIAHDITISHVAKIIHNNNNNSSILHTSVKNVFYYVLLTISNSANCFQGGHFTKLEAL